MPRKSAGIVFLVLTILTAGCGSRETREQEHREANTPAGKVGQVAHKMAVQADKAGHAIGQQLEKGAHDAHEGWKEDAQKDHRTR